ncbi:fatty-acid amide hydrolase [Aureobasidium pullulans]|uniref:amidase n=1 Tax=Aureobasidium pullulans TaxID=5580 RepID=A0A4S8S4E5_AURPU|nr:fatty-acid amide hydrolase [Aureobasidium pullulans]THW56884.1 fatty-acid amide hydrolase [Aureobasidium pullulans]
MPAAKDWERKAQICRDILENSIPKQWLLPSEKLPTKSHNVTQVPYTCGILSDEELHMTEQTAAGLLSKYQSGEWKVEQVIIAFLKRATIGQQLLNFVTEFLTDEALETAKALDKHFETTGKLIGPLHGVPISVKEHVSYGGKITHAGFVSQIGNVAKGDALLVQLLKKAGAVFTVRTNQPQSLMHLDCENNITGTTLNPYHLKLSPGGSSGGEGASMGFKCAVLGVGTDIGGSIRAPAAFNNSYGLRPTTLRNPTLGLHGVLGGQESIKGVIGPLGQSIDDLWLFQKALVDQNPHDIDTTLAPLPWKGELDTPKNITVGIMMTDGVVKPHPPILRALETAKSKLQAAGVKVVDWENYKHDHAWDIVSALYFPDGGKRILNALADSGEPMLPLTQHALNYSKAISISENWDLNVMRETYRREYHALMKERGVDVILCPAYVGAGVKQHGAKYWGYTSLWNILDQPAVVFPTGMDVDKSVDVVEEGYSPLNTKDKEEYEAYDPELFHGVPITLQLVGKHYHDEETLRAAKLVESVIRK